MEKRSLYGTASLYPTGDGAFSGSPLFKKSWSDFFLKPSRASQAVNFIADEVFPSVVVIRMVEKKDFTNSSRPRNTA